MEKNPQKNSMVQCQGPEGGGRLVAATAPLISAHYKPISSYRGSYFTFTLRYVHFLLLPRCEIAPG